MGQENLTKLARHQFISVPESVSKQFSDNSYAEVCFPQQKFCRNLQEFIASYSITVTSPFTLTDESYPAIEKAQEK